jgi:hypothetical protein
MGGFDPVYDCEEIEGLSVKERQMLRAEVLRQLNTSPQIRELLRKKTLPVFRKLMSKRRKAALRRRK